MTRDILKPNGRLNTEAMAKRDKKESRSEAQVYGKKDASIAKRGAKKDPNTMPMDKGDWRAVKADRAKDSYLDKKTKPKKKK